MSNHTNSEGFICGGTRGRLSNASKVFVISIFIRLIFQVFPEMCSNIYFTTCSYFIAYGEIVCVVLMCEGQRRRAMLLACHLADRQVPVSMLLLSDFMHRTCIITVIVTCAAVALNSAVTVTVAVTCIVTTGVTLTWIRKLSSLSLFGSVAVFQLAHLSTLCMLP